ncbi:MAG: hypothetical protein ACLFU8_13805 [Anaerolineales bacterium]
MRWLDLLNRDPVPWLIDPVNPSARLLTLEHIFNRSPEALAQEEQRILDWSPVKSLIEQADWIHLWGRATNPYYGGVMGTFGSLYILTQLGVPAFRLATLACENLLQRGRLEDGRFAPPDGGPVSWICYTGMALRVLWHFGLGDDPRTDGGKRALVHTVLHHPEYLDHNQPGSASVADLIKALHGLLSIPREERTEEDESAIALLTRNVLNYDFDFGGREADWLQLRYPRYHDSDLLELCHLLASTTGSIHPRFQDLLRRMREMQTEEGRWLKIQAAPGTFQFERVGQPSRWLTFEAVHSLMLVYGGNTYAA